MYIIYRAHVVRRVAVLLVVKGVSAEIRTEFFIGSAFDRLAALRAFFFHVTLISRIAANFNSTNWCNSC